MSASSSSTTKKTGFSSMNVGDKSKIQKINSPLAKYNSIGQLSCIICNQVIKSELLWNAHLNSKTHVENKNKLKTKITSEQLKANKTEEITSTKEDKSSANTLKRNFSSSEISEKLSNTKFDENDDFPSTLAVKKIKIDEKSNQDKSEKASTTNLNKKIEITEKNSENDQQQIVGGVLPEGFFDDRELDARIRGVDREQNLNDQYEEFKRIIQSEDLKSEINNLKEDQIRDVDRDLEEVEELINRWQHIENLHQKRDEILKNKKETKNKEPMETNNVESDDSDVDLDNILSLSLRTKKRC